MTKRTWDDLIDLEPQWREVFAEEMPFGFCVSPSIYDIMTECIRTKSQKPLDDYIESLDPETMY